MTEMNRVCDIKCEILTTDRLVLRQPHRDDVEDMALLANNYEIAKNLARMPYPYFDADARDFLKKITGDGADKIVSLVDSNSKLFGQVAKSHVPRTYVLDKDGKILWFDLEYSQSTRRSLTNALTYFLKNQG